MLRFSGVKRYPVLKLKHGQLYGERPWNSLWHEGCEVQVVVVSSSGVEVGHIVRAREPGSRWGDWEPDARLDDLLHRNLLPWVRLKDAKADVRQWWHLFDKKAAAG